MISGIRLSGSDREESESNRLWVSREAVVSNSDVEKFGIPHFKHSHTMFLPKEHCMGRIAGQNNGSKKQGIAENQEILVAQKYYISSLEGKINHLENTLSVLQKAIENGTLVQNLSTEDNTSQNQQSNQKQCFCTGPEDIKYKLLENRLLILENSTR